MRASDVNEANRFSDGHFKTLQCQTLHAFRPSQGEVIPFMTGAHVESLMHLATYLLVQLGICQMVT